MHRRQFLQTAAGRKSLRERGGVEQRIAHLAGLGIRPSRYFGRKKTCLQGVMAAVVANFSRLAGFRRQRAQQVGAAVEKAWADLRDGLFAAALTLSERSFPSRPSLRHRM